MPEDDLTDLIRERKRRAACEAAGIPYVQDTLPTRPAPACDPVEPPVPDTLRAPNKQPSPDPPDRVLPGPLTINSPLVVANCSGTVGGVGSAESPYGKSTSLLYLDDIVEVTRSELYRTAPMLPALQLEIDANLEPLVAGSISAQDFDDSIMAASSLEVAAAAAIRAEALRIREELFKIANLTATSLLVCQFPSDAVWVTCDSTTDNGYASLPAVPVSGAYVYRPAGSESSTVSVEDATLLAARDAAVDLECVYFNETQTITCADINPVFNYTYEPAFVWEGHGSYGTLQALWAAGFHAPSLDSLNVDNFLVYTVVKTPSALFSSSTQEAANDKALAAATRELNCFFPSRAAVIDCETRSATGNPVVDRIDEGYTKAEVFEEMDIEYVDSPIGHKVTNYGLLPRGSAPVALDSSEGLIFDAPAGMVISLSSQADADTEARNHALGFLACFWLSPAVSCSCTNADAELGAGPESYFRTEAELDDLHVYLNRTASVVALSFLKGELGSSEDGPLDTASTLNLCKASLACTFCNDTIAPTCAGDAPHAPGAPHVPGTPYTDAELPIPFKYPDDSLTITAGLPAGVICDSDPDLIHTLAVATGAIPPPLPLGGGGAPSCLYGNQEQEVKCPPRTVNGAVGSGEGEPEAGYNYYHNAAASVSPIIVAKGTVTADTQAHANTAAILLGKASLRCVYLSPAIDVLCGAKATFNPPDPTGNTLPDSDKFQLPSAAVEIGDGKLLRPGTSIRDSVTNDSLGSVARHVEVPYGVAMSLSSPKDAFMQALLIGMGSLYCFFRNQDMPASCDTVVGGAPGATLSAVVLAGAAPISTVSQKDANDIATLMAKAKLRCLYTNTQQNGFVDCQPGETTLFVNVAAGTVISSDSQEDANSSAEALADSMSRCIPSAKGNRASCPLCGTFESSNDERDGWVTVSGGKVRQYEPAGTADILVNSAVVQAVSDWYVECGVEGGLPSGGCIIRQWVSGSEVPLAEFSSDGISQTKANYPGTGKGCGDLRFMQGLYGGHLAWLLAP